MKVTAVLKIYVSLILGLLVLASLAPVNGLAAGTTSDALKMISDFAERLCGSIPTESSVSKKDVEGKVNAELPGVLKDLANVGGEVGAKAEQQTTKGVLQQDLAKALKDAADCRVEVLKILKGALLPSAAVSPGNDVHDGFVNATYQGKMADDDEAGTWFEVSIQFTSTDAARWRDNNSSGWSTLKVETLSPHKVILSSVAAGNPLNTWELEFSEDFRNVTGTTRSQKINHHYTITGSRLK